MSIYLCFNISSWGLVIRLLYSLLTSNLIVDNSSFKDLVWLDYSRESIYWSRSILAYLSFCYRIESKSSATSEMYSSTLGLNRFQLFDFIIMFSFWTTINWICSSICIGSYRWSGMMNLIMCDTNLSKSFW